VLKTDLSQQSKSVGSSNSSISGGPRQVVVFGSDKNKIVKVSDECE